MSADEQKRLARQIRAARAYLGWTRARLAKEALVAEKTVTAIERGYGGARATTVSSIILALRSGGVSLGGSGEPVLWEVTETGG